MDKGFLRYLHSKKSHAPYASMWVYCCINCDSEGYSKFSEPELISFAQATRTMVRNFIKALGITKDDSEIVGKIRVYKFRVSDVLELETLKEETKTQSAPEDLLKEIQYLKQKLSELETNKKDKKPRTKKQSDSQPELPIVTEGIGPYLKVGKKVYKMNFDEFFKTKLSSKIKEFENQHPGALPEEVFEKMQRQYICYDFNSNNHVFNSFMKIYREMTKEKDQSTFKKNINASREDNRRDLEELRDTSAIFLQQFNPDKDS